MTVESAKAKLDAQEGDPATGYISKADHQDSYDELVDDTALTGATTAEALDVTGALTAGTVNGRDPDDLVAGPASATDNALARFDGTGGKTVQNSGITVDDSGRLSSPLNVYAPGTTCYVDADNGVPATYGSYFRFLGAGVPRWAFGRQGGSQAFLIHAANASGVYNGNYALYVDNATNRFRVDGSATAGLELGASGPRMMSGTGSPEGVVTAPVGSIWFQTDSTVGVSHWRKASGTGNTGWVVMEGDTGSRNIASGVLTAGTGITVDFATIRRTGNLVTFLGGFSWTGAATDKVLLNMAHQGLPSGFRPSNASRGYSFTAVDGNVSAVGTVLWHPSSGDPYGLRYLGASTTNTRANEFSWITADAWPTSLPGT